MHIARVGDAEIDSGSMLMRAVKSGPNVALERLSVAGLDGASLDLQGAIGPSSMAATGRLRADQLHDFAVLVSRLAPGDWSRILVERAAELSPAALTFDAHGAGGAAAHRIHAGEWIGGRNPVHDCARPAAEGERPRPDPRARIRRIPARCCGSWGCARRRPEAGARHVALNAGGGMGAGL